MFLKIFSMNWSPSSRDILSFCIAPCFALKLLLPSACTFPVNPIKYGGSVNTMSAFSLFIKACMSLSLVLSPHINRCGPSWYISPFLTVTSMSSVSRYSSSVVSVSVSVSDNLSGKLIFKSINSSSSKPVKSTS